MKNKLIAVFAIFGMITMAAPVDVLAQSADLAALQEQVKSLTRKVAALEGANSGSSYGSGYVMPTEGDAKGGLIHTMQDIEFGGYIETRYTAHIDTNGSGGTGVADIDTTVPAAAGLGLPGRTGRAGRIFDRAEGFTVNQANIWFKKEAAAEGGAGFLIDILAGKDAAIIDFDPTTDGDDFAFKQAYVEVNTPLPFFEDSDILPDTVNWKMGRFATIAGMEVIEPADNWNISRSFTFGFGLPFTHTGLRANFDLFDGALDVTAGVNNGWDNDFETNDFRTMELGVGYDINDSVSYYTTILFGPENAGQADNKRFLWTHVLTWSVSDALTLAANIDWGHENDAPTIPSGRDANYWQTSLYANYQINEEWAFTYRFELFRDINRFRGVTGTNDTFVGNTFTLEYTPYENLITRLEYRLDTANSGNGVVFGGDSNASSLSAQMIYLI